MFVVSSWVSRANREMVDFDEGDINGCIDLIRGIERRYLIRIGYFNCIRRKF